MRLLNSSLRGAVAALVLAATSYVLAAPAGSPLTGAGSTFAEPLYKKWSELEQQTGGTGVTYDGVGSGEGVKRIIAKAVEFGASDEPMKRSELEEKGLRQFPSAIGAIVVAINLPGVPKGELKLSPEALAGIYMGKIKKWNDPAILATNDDIANKLPSLAITPVSRSDGSGSTFVFTYLLAARVPAWKAGPGVGKLMQGIVGEKAEGTGGVVKVIQRTPGAIGYIDFGRARKENIDMAQLPNRAGVFIKPTVESIQASAKFDAEQLVYTPDPDFYLVLANNETYAGWPLATATFIVLPRNSKDAHKVLDFFYWAFRNGDESMRAMGYVPLSDTMKIGVRKAWNRQYGYKAGL